LPQIANTLDNTLSHSPLDTATGVAVGLMLKSAISIQMIVNAWISRQAQRRWKSHWAEQVLSI
jgi:hypothetical protein